MHLAAAERAARDTVTLPHRLLLADPGEMTDVGAAVRKAAARARS